MADIPILISFAEKLKLKPPQRYLDFLEKMKRYYEIGTCSRPIQKTLSGEIRNGAKVLQKVRTFLLVS